jgi:hypothetical protein
MPRLNRLRAGSLLIKIDLDLLRSELQAISASDLRSRRECCSNARAAANFSKELSRQGTLVPAFDAIKHSAGRSSVVEAGILIALAGR